MCTKIKIDLLAYVLDTPTSCQETLSLFHSCWKYVLLMVFLLFVSMSYWLDLSIYVLIYLPKKPNPTTHQSSEKNKQFIVAFKMDIFRDKCPSLRTQNNCLARTRTWVFSILASINLSLAYEISSIFRYNINTKLTLQAYY